MYGSPVRRRSLQRCLDLAQPLRGLPEVVAVLQRALSLLDRHACHSMARVAFVLVRQPDASRDRAGSSGADVELRLEPAAVRTYLGKSRCVTSVGTSWPVQVAPFGPALTSVSVPSLNPDIHDVPKLAIAVFCAL